MEEIRSKYQIDTSAVGGIVVYSLTQFVVNRLFITQNDWLSCALHALIKKKNSLKFVPLWKYFTFSGNKVPSVNLHLIVVEQRSPTFLESGFSHCNF